MARKLLFRKIMNEQKFYAWVREWLILTAAIVFATWALAGIRADNLLSLMSVAAVISLLNAFMRPVLLLFSLPFIVATFGLGMIFVLWIINSFFLYFASGLFSSFHVASFGTAMLGALFISGAQLVLNIIFGVKPRNPLRTGFGNGQSPNAGTPPPQAPRAPKRKPRENDDDVIDI